MPPMPLIATKLARNIAIVYHRTLDGHIKKFPNYHQLTTREVYERANTLKTLKGQPITIYTLEEQSIVPKSGFQRKDQDFASYATNWEKHMSKLASKDNDMDPFVDGAMLVVGHVGWVGGDTICMSSRDYAIFCERFHDGIEVLLEKNVEMLVLYTTPAFCSDRTDTNCATYEIPPGYRSFSQLTGSEATSYNVVTDMDGRVVAILGSRQPRGLVTPWINPVDLILVPYLAGKVLASRAAVLTGEAAASAAELGMGAKSAIWTLARRGSARLAGGARAVFSRVFRREVEVTEGMIVEEQLTGGVTRRFGRITAEEMTEHLDAVLTARPDLRRLMAARVMTGAGRMDAIKIALKEFEDSQRWKVVEKTAAEMEAVTTRNNIVHMRAETRELWINSERAARWDPEEFYEQVVHDLGAHALVGHGGEIGHLLAYISDRLRALTNSLRLLEHTIMHEGGTGWISRAFGGG